MNNPRVTFNFKDLNEGYGWSATLWPFGKVTLPDALDTADQLSLKWTQFLGRNIVLSDMRASFDDETRDSQLRAGPEPKVQPNGDLIYNVALANDAVAPVNSTLNLRLEATRTYRGSLFLSGCTADPLSIYAKSGLMSPPYAKLLQKFQDELIQHWAIKVLPRVPQDGVVLPVQGAVFFPAPITITCNGHGLTSGDTVRIDKMRVLGGRFSCSNLPVTVTGVNTFQLLTYKRPFAGITYVGGGQLQKLNPPVYKPISAALLDGVSSHKRGRFSGERRGKARTR